LSAADDASVTPWIVPAQINTRSLDFARDDRGWLW
jgi:hypothetical protein